MQAVNEGNVFQFLAKPSSSFTLANALTLGIKQYRLVTAEKELLEKTLKGCIELMTELLSTANSGAFGRAS